MLSMSVVIYSKNNRFNIPFGRCGNNNLLGTSLQVTFGGLLLHEKTS